MTNNNTTDISYFKGILYLTLEENHPERVLDPQFIEERSELAEQIYAEAIQAGKTTIEAEEVATDVLMMGLQFSKVGTIRSVLYAEYANYTDWDTNLDMAIKLLPKLEGIFENYILTDYFDETPQYEQLYNELTGALYTILEEDGI